MLGKVRAQPMSGAAAGVILGSMIVPAACGTQSDTGTVRGNFLMTEGGVELRVVPGQGQLVVRQNGKLVSSARIASRSTFAISLPEGTYQVGVQVKGSYLLVECQPARSVSVATSRVVTLALRCDRDPAIG